MRVSLNRPLASHNTSNLALNNTVLRIKINFRKLLFPLNNYLLLTFFNIYHNISTTFKLEIAIRYIDTYMLGH